MEIVNGYPCRDCTDVALAKKNIDPAHPEEARQPKRREQVGAADAIQGVFGPAIAPGSYGQAIPAAVTEPREPGRVADPPNRLLDLVA